MNKIRTVSLCSSVVTAMKLDVFSMHLHVCQIESTLTTLHGDYY